MVDQYFPHAIFSCHLGSLSSELDPTVNLNLKVFYGSGTSLSNCSGAAVPPLAISDRGIVQAGERNGEMRKA